MFRTKNSVHRSIGLGLAAAGLLLAACGGSSSGTSPSAASGVTTQASIASEVPASIKGTVVQFATDATYAPNEYINPDTGQIQGWDIDLANAICKVMGLVCTANNVTFDDIIAQLKASTPAEQAGGDKPRYQFSISSWTPTAKREMSGIDFVSYFQAGEAWVAKAGGPKISTAADMCGHKVAVETGTVEESDAWGFMGKMVGGTPISADTDHCAGHDMTVDSYVTQTQADAALRSGRDDIGFLDRPVAEYEVKVTGGKFGAGALLVNSQPCGVAPYGIAMVQNAPLEKPIEDAVKYLMDNGFYTQILKSWNVQAGALTSSQVTVNNNNQVGGVCVPSY